MEHFGIWGAIPPLLAVGLAFATKDVFVSLFLGILSGAIIVSGGNFFDAMMRLADLLAASLSDPWNIRIFLFCALLGGLVGLLSRTGAAGAFAKWTSAKLKTARGSQMTVLAFGILIFIDDYFNSLTVGTVMRPISDKTKTSRAKLAYILDSTAAPVCILAPISSWVVTVMSIVRSSDGFEKLGVTEFQFFIRSIPLNLYAILTLAMILTTILTGRDFGPMAKSQKLAEKGILFDSETYGSPSGDIVEKQNPRARAFDMLFPILTLIASAVLFFPLVTWISAVKDGSAASILDAAAKISIGRAFNETDASVALMYSIICTIFLTYIYYFARRLVTLKVAGDSLRDGIQSMVPALVTLTMAWSIGTIIKSSPAEGGLGLGKFLSETVMKGNFPIGIIPAVIFLLSAAIAFATGTSWGTFGIMIPIAIPISTSISSDMGMSLIFVGAVLSGAVFGDHASPISDTTILSSTGACCPHLEHVATQMPYAIFVASCAFCAFCVAGFTENVLAAWILAAAIFVAGNAVLPKMFGFREKSGGSC